MENLLLSCIESRVESDRTFYGRFQLGPFEKGQALTVATALRRSLLSELKGLAITAVKIDGVSHEYSTIKGVRESVVNILLNLKQIVLTSDFELQTPEIGFLNVKGPGIVTSNDLKLPISVQCVDSKQYIATLSHDSVLKMKFLIAHGKNYINQNPDDINIAFFHPRVNSFSQNLSSFAYSSSLLRETKTTSSRKDLLVGENKAFFRSDVSSLNSGEKDSQEQQSKKGLTRIKKSKVNSLGEFEKKENQTSIQNSSRLDSLKLDELLDSKNHKLKKVPDFNKFALFPTDQVQQKKNQLNDKNLISLVNKNKNEQGSSSVGNVPFFSLNNQFSYKEKQPVFEDLNTKELNSLKSESNKNILSIDAVFMPINKVNFLIELEDDIVCNDKIEDEKEFSFSSPPKVDVSYKSKVKKIKQRKKNLKERIILEVWTNGSIHPRQAIHEAAKSLIQLFFPFQEPSFLKSLFFTSNRLPKKICNHLEEKLETTVKNDNLFLEKKRFLIDIGNLDLSLRPYTCLKRANINTIGELLEYSSQELLLLKNFGKRSLEEVEKNLTQIGLKLRYQEDTT